MSSTIRSVFAVFALAAIGSPLSAQAARTVTLDQALTLFARNSLALRLARADAAETAANALQAGAWPNPTLTGTHESLSGDRPDASESYLNLSQRIEWPGTRSARIESAELASAAAGARFAADSARLAYEVKAAYTSAVRAQRAVALMTEVTDVFRRGLASAEARLAEGDLSRYDRRRMEVERARYEHRLAEAELEAAAARRQLALLVVPEGEEGELVPTDSLEPLPPAGPADVTLAEVIERRPDVAAAEAASRAALAATSLARRERVPELTATGGLKRQSDGLSGFFVGLSFPLPILDRRDGAVQATEARARAAASRASLVRRQVWNDVQRALDQYRSLVRRAELLAGDGTADLLEIAQVAYAEGEMELLALLDAAEAHLEARLAETRLRAALWTRYYDLERAVGGFDGPATDLENDR